jgi:hypothetical protein
LRLEKIREENKPGEGGPYHEFHVIMVYNTFSMKFLITDLLPSTSSRSLRLLDVWHVHVVWHFFVWWHEDCKMANKRSGWITYVRVEPVYTVHPCQKSCL